MHSVAIAILRVETFVLAELSTFQDLTFWRRVTTRWIESINTYEKYVRIDAT